MKVIIMAGGEGSRLRPLTCDRPKPMVPLVNRPMMEHIVALLKRHNLTEIGVTLQYLPEQIKKYFADGREFGVNMRYYIEDIPLGTAGSVKNAASFLDETFLVISGDALTDFDLQKAITFHRQKGGLATIVLTSVDNPLEYGIVITDTEDRITQFLEKPSWGEVFSDTVNTGIYILEPEVLQFIPAKTKFDFSQDLFPLLMAKGYPLYGYVAEGYWCDIGNLQQYHQAHLDILQGRVKIDLDAKEIAPGVFVEENVVIADDAQITGPVFIGRGAHIKEKARVEEYSVIGAQTTVDSYASVKRSLCWRNVYIAPQAEIRGAILANRVRVLRGASLFEGAVVGDDTVVGENCRLKPNVKVWPHKNIDNGSIVAESIIWGVKPAKKLFGNDGVSGIVNLEITPELVAKLSAAYGSLLGENSQVAVSSDDWKASRMLKEAAVAGLLSSGTQVYDLGVSVTPISRQAIKRLPATGGMHFRISPYDNAAVQIKFFDAEGLSLTKAMERKIEQTYYREDFKRSKSTDVGEVIKMTQTAALYWEELPAKLDLNVFAAKRRKVLLAYPTPWLYQYLVPLLQQLNCEVITISAQKEPLTLAAMQEQFPSVAEAVKQNAADLGVMMDANAEKLFLFDQEGCLIADELLTALISAIVFRSKQGGTMAVPVTAPSIIEKLAQMYQGKVVRTKTAPRAVMEALYNEEAEGAKYDPFLLSFDALAALTKILEYLASEGLELSALVKSIPPFHMHKRQVDCSWKAKGTVMRRLIEDSQGDEVELIDGIKVKHPQGWALVLPDSEKPIYRIYSEGSDAEAAAELTDFYAEKIKKYQKEIK
ncbi:MAG: NTP transferase domain-containing protein [Firmicutes bacterium]|nr:NTP transferase domain-containing protein [Bacillota bacterium]